MRVTVTPGQIRSAFEAVKDDPSLDESRGLWEGVDRAGSGRASLTRRPR
jgi:hypothetical protein